MDDLISRNVAINALIENKEMINAVLDSLTLDYNTRKNQEQRRGQINEDIETIKALPSAERVGKWIDEGENSAPICSVCKSRALLNYESDYHKSQFCPHCGAKMDK